MDASDDAGIDAEGPLDPRIQIELENLNNATDEINKLEIELDEAHTAFRQLLSDSTRRLQEIANKIGTGCIEKARCYYKAQEVAQQAQVQCQRQAQLFQRASEIHSAAKETVALAESRFMSHQHEWNFDQAWQDMLNHATIKVMDAENQKAECGREHLKRATLFHDAEKKVQHLEEKYRRAIIKSRLYFEVRAQCNEMLATQKSRVEYLQRGVKKAKDAYATSLRVLEDISNQIHQRRRDYDIMTKGPREPGVGAELISPTESLSYETELDKLSLTRVNSVASSEPDIDERTGDFEDIHDLKQRIEHLNSRSVDGSESNACQWELELQASVERLNTLPIRKLNSCTTGELSTDFSNLKSNESRELFDKNPTTLFQIQESWKKNDNESPKVIQGLTDVKKPLARTDSTTASCKIWTSMPQTPMNLSLNNLNCSSINHNVSSKSLNNCINKQKLDDLISNDNILPIDQQDSEKCDEPNNVEQEREKQTCVKKKISVDTSNLEIAEFTSGNLNKLQIDEEDKTQKSKTLSYSGCVEHEDKCKLKNDFHQKVSHFSKSDNNPGAQNRTNRENFKEYYTSNAQYSKTLNFESNSSASTPVKRQILKPKVAKSYENNLDRDFVECPKPEKPSPPKTSSVKELPLLSIIQRFPESRFSKNKSSSMVDLAGKQTLKTFMDHANF